MAAAGQGKQWGSEMARCGGWAYVNIEETQLTTRPWFRARSAEVLLARLPNTHAHVDRKSAVDSIFKIPFLSSILTHGHV